jgi:hypothetical protein
MKKQLLTTLLILLAIVSCRKDRFLKDEIRCSINGERVSTSYQKSEPGLSSKDKASITMDSSERQILIKATIGPEEDQYKYSFEIQIDTFRGIGIYDVKHLKISSEINSMSFTYPFYLNKTYDTYFEIKNYVPEENLIVAVFHFVCTNSQQEKMFFSNGLIRMNYKKTT